MRTPLHWREALAEQGRDRPYCSGTVGQLQGLFPTGLHADPPAGGRVDASVPERADKGTPPTGRVEGDRAMVATYVSTRLTYSPLVSQAGSVGCRLTTCAVSIPTKGSNRQTSLVNVYYPAGSSKIAEVAWLKNLNPET